MWKLKSHDILASWDKAIGRLRLIVRVHRANKREFDGYLTPWQIELNGVWFTSGLLLKWYVQRKFVLSADLLWTTRKIHKFR